MIDPYQFKTFRLLYKNDQILRYFVINPFGDLVEFDLSIIEKFPTKPIQIFLDNVLYPYNYIIDSKQIHPNLLKTLPVKIIYSSRNQILK